MSKVISRRIGKMLKFTDYDIVFREIPDEVTLAINLSNCPHRCPGCHSRQLQQDIGAELSCDVLMSLINRYKDDITCVCFMGGDASPDDVCRLAAVVKSDCGLKTGWYSGNSYLYDDKCKAVFDFIKLGDYRQALGGLDKPTTNQRLYRIEAETLHDITYKFLKK